MGEISGFINVNFVSSCEKCGKEFVTYEARYKIDTVCLKCRRLTSKKLKELRDARKKTKCKS